MNIPKIEKGIPFEPIGGERSDFLRNMEVGDSFEITSSDRQNWIAPMHRLYKKCPDMKFITRKQENNKIRIWRTK